MELTISVLAERPDLVDEMWDMETSWPEFMRHDPLGALYYGHLDRFLDFTLVAQDAASEIVAKAHSLPCVLGDEPLPDHGWDAVVRSGLFASLRGERPDAVSAIEIAIRPDLQGQGLSAVMLGAMRDNARRHGFAELVAPVRPSGKSDVHQPMSAYAFQVRDDGLPVDPWLRVHVRAGGVIDRVAPRSMVIPGTLEEWREWSGLPFDTTGPVEVPKALATVWCDAEHGTATYVEPNVWVRHRTGA